MSNGRKARVKGTAKPRSQRRSRKRARQGAVPISAEFRYLTEHARELEKFGGEWLLIHGPKLVAHSPQFSDIERVIQREQIAVPFIHYVPKDEEVNFVDVIA